MPTLGVATIKKKQRERILGGTESRKPILANVKTEVYKRAKGCCESCGENLKKSEGDFHHWRSPKISPTAQTVQFLCPTCHREYGHTIQVVVHRGILRKWKESTIVQLKVKKHPKKKSKDTLKKPKTKKKTTRKKTPNKSKNKKKKKTSTTAYFISK